MVARQPSKSWLKPSEIPYSHQGWRLSCAKGVASPPSYDRPIPLDSGNPVEHEYLAQISILTLAKDSNAIPF
ncbi:hypothetical protein C2857_000732 [Epichloe festucae Fl1]|uniref:Uncharacterized protein n=1 Tax=Epichloe festucae (strain Fl1) TaxID=877507 RepID=A0A7S9PWJ3_EPIFF|nr:hypothetical protein C2857_000732 [Epichloe festucae Fl1]